MNTTSSPKSSLSRRSGWLLALFGLFLAVGVCANLSAATYDYIGSGGTTTAPATGNWATAASWSGSMAPTSSLDNVLTFGGSGSGTYSSRVNMGSAFDLNKIILNSSSSGLSTIQSSGSPTSTLNFVNNSSSSGPRITQNGTGNFYFTIGTSLTNTLTIDGTGTGIMEFKNGGGSFTGTSGIIMSGAGVLKLSEYNSFTGGITINSGTVDAGYGNTNRLGAGPVTLAGGTLILSNPATWNYASTTVTADSTMVSNQKIAGAGGTNTVSGPLSIGANTLTVQAGTNVTSGTAGLRFSGTTTLTGDAAFSVDSAVQLQLGVIAGADHTITKSGAGELLLSGDSKTVNEFIVNGGTLTTGSGNNLDNTVAFTINNGTLYLTEANISAGAVKLVNGSITGATGASLVGTSYDMRNGSVSKVLTGTATLTKSTGGTVTLSGTNTYSGDTLITAGTLIVNGSIASSYVGLDPGATLAGTGTVSGTVNTAGTTAMLSPGDSGVGTLTLGALDADLAGAGFNFELGTFSDLLAINGLFTGSSAAGGLNFNFSDSGGLAAGNPYTLITFGSASGLDYADFSTGSLAPGFALDTSFGTGGYKINANDIQVQFIPEPSTFALLLGATGLLLGTARRRRS